MTQKQDIEYVMNTIETTVKANIQDYIDEMNTEKGDSLLPDFETSSYLTYRLNGVVMPNFKISFLQYFNSTPTNGISGATAVEAQIAIDVIISLVNDTKADIRLVRYMRIIKQIIDKKILPKFSGSNVVSTDYVQGRDANDRLFVIGQTVIGGINVI